MEGWTGGRKSILSGHIPATDATGSLLRILPNTENDKTLTVPIAQDRTVAMTAGECNVEKLG